MRKKKSSQKENAGKDLKKIILQENAMLKKILRQHRNKKALNQSKDKTRKQYAKQK